MFLRAVFACALASGLAAQTTTTDAPETSDGFRTLIKANQRIRDFATKSSTTITKTGTTRVAFSDPNKPGTLKINDAFRRVEIQGVTSNEAAGGEVVISSFLEVRGVNSSQTVGTDTRQNEAAAHFDLVEKDNVISLTFPEGIDNMSRTLDFKIQVPRDTNIIIESTMSRAGRQVTIAGTDGDVDITMQSGDVALKNTTGAITVNTRQGAIGVELDIAPQKIVKLTSSIKNIDLSLPATATANVIMGTPLGTVRTNFLEDTFKMLTDPDAAAAGWEILFKAQEQWHKDTMEDMAKRQQARATENTAEKTADKAPSPAPARSATENNADDNSKSGDERIAAVRAEINRRRAEKGLPPRDFTSEPKRGTQSENERLEDIRAEIARRQQSRPRPEENDGRTSPFRSPSRTPSRSMLDRTIVGELNGGGVDIHLITLGGTITLRRAE